MSKDNVRTGVAEGKLIFATTSSGVRLATFGDAGADRTQVCRVQLRQFGPWLLVDDGVTDNSNSACGGLGVTLNGIYRRLNVDSSGSGNFVQKRSRGDPSTFAVSCYFASTYADPLQANLRLFVPLLGCPADGSSTSASVRFFSTSTRSK
jgi:hypothetical protein